MNHYLIKFFATLIAAICLHLGVILYVHGPIKAEYWVRPLIIVKRDIAAHTASPKIVFLGGSGTLFNINAKEVSEATGLPVVNFGLHAGLRLERILDEAPRIAHKGDLFVLPLEPPFYQCDQGQWTEWQLENAIAWDHAYFDKLPLSKRVRVIFDSATPTFSFEILGAWIRSKISSSSMKERLAALAPASEILKHFRAARRNTGQFSYSAYNLDSRGMIENNVGAKFSGEGYSVTVPNAICNGTTEALRSFIKTMNAKGARVLFAYTPYLIESTDDENWRAADATFRHDLSQANATIIGERDQFFLSRDMFFNTSMHLNVKGREVYTKAIIKDLAKATAYP